jgi:hypothetical protein
MLSVLLAVSLAAASEKPKMMVLELAPTGGAAVEIASTLTDAVATEVAARGFFEVISAKDVQTLLGVERQRQLIGCSDDGHCLTELAGAIGSRFVLSGQLGRVGEAYQLTLESLDTQKQRPLGRSTRIAKDPQSLRRQLAWAVAEATSTPLPSPPSHWLPYSVGALGAAALLAGGYFGVDGLSREGQVAATIQAGQQGQTPLSTLTFYQRQAQTGARERTASLALLGAGAGLLGLAVLLNPPDVGGQVVLVPTSRGIGLAGGWR